MPQLWEKKVTLQAFQKKNEFPETPGVYFFLNEQDQLLYIGKATSLRDRVRSYFIQDIIETRGPKIRLMLERIASIGYMRTDSVLEALILESNLIKAEQPPYNTDAKDNKSFNHVVITKETFPRVLIVRGRDIEQKKFTDPVKYIFGPFPAGGALRDALKIVRRLFPYRDRCLPESGKPCFSAQIGLCPGVCAGVLSAKEYGRTINHIRLFFEGHKSDVVKQLEREMKVCAKERRFEQAGAIKKTLFGLHHIQDMALIKDDLREKHAHRIEAYDVAHLSGTASVGVMVVVEESRPNKNEYRQFKLREKHNGNDLSALEEILTRRLKHKEWTLPELIVVDGAHLQFERAEQVLREMEITIPIVGVVKDVHHKADRLIGPVALIERFEKEILLANTEAHRFAITFHRKRREKEFLPKQ
ncbi:MAG: GIY-YIG nuclease family protein [Candidatus Moranbacteria bacterium]|jgi:excinuclease ABC subunit C|nr:GIY-YIG nuclease family protein [Candidatus Moranbacteria bacterium]